MNSVSDDGSRWPAMSGSMTVAWNRVSLGSTSARVAVRDKPPPEVAHNDVACPSLGGEGVEVDQGLRCVGCRHE